jgi:hypothetical protein
MDGLIFPHKAKASHTRWGALYRSVGLQSPYSTDNLLFRDAQAAWNSGRFAPVTLTLDFGRSLPMTGITVTPEMRPQRGLVELVIRVGPTLVAHSSQWTDGAPVAIEWPDAIEARTVTLEFLRSPSWIALRATTVRVAKK